MNHEQLDNQVDKIVFSYQDLEAYTFQIIINTLDVDGISDYEKTNILDWQIKQLSKLNMLTNDVVKQLAKKSHETNEQLRKMILENGYKIVDDVDGQLKEITGKSVPVSQEVARYIKALSDGAFGDLTNVVNETLLSRNPQQSVPVQVYRDIVTKTTIEVINGNRTPEQALFRTIYDWIGSGLPTKLQDKAGKNWSLETYARMVVGNTAHQEFNDLRLDRTKEYGIGQALMSSHPAAREACAGIQGTVVNIVPNSDERYNPRYDSIYNHGYGDAGGTQGVNCRHMLTPFDPDFNKVPSGYNDDRPTPKQAEENAKVQAKQRYYERTIRSLKKQLNVAEQLGDKQTAFNLKSRISNQQSNIRDLVKNYDFLKRDYSREKIS